MVDEFLFQSVKNDDLEFAPYGRKIVETNLLSEILKKVGFRKVREGVISKKMSREEVKDFYVARLYWPPNNRSSQTHKANPALTLWKELQE